MNQYPEHDKLSAVKDQSQTIGAFLEWMPSNGYYVGQYIQDPEWKDYQFVPSNLTINQLLAEYFEVDLDKLEDEKRQMLESIREMSRV